LLYDVSPLWPSLLAALLLGAVVGWAIWTWKARIPRPEAELPLPVGPRAEDPLDLSADSPARSSAQDAPAVAREGDHAGIRPGGFGKPVRAKIDDLKRIRGIGPINEAALNALGIWRFDQIAAWTPGNLLWLGSYLGLPERIEREQWIVQAGILAAEGNSHPKTDRPDRTAREESDDPQPVGPLRN
jgi:predicted flap endonuclease-1-like 5' DNA nuclease